MKLLAAITMLIATPAISQNLPEPDVIAFNGFSAVIDQRSSDADQARRNNIPDQVSSLANRLCESNAKTAHIGSVQRMDFTARYLFTCE